MELRRFFDPKKYPYCDKGHAWKPIKGFPGYHVCSDGRVYSEPRKDSIGRPIRGSGFLMKQQIVRRYKYVGLSKNGKAKLTRVHRIVANTFVPNPKKYKIVNHLDGDKFNNCFQNLEWCTDRQNVRHAIENGLRGTTRGISKANLDPDKIRLIRKLLKSGNSQDYVSSIFKVSPATISMIHRGVSWNHVK